MDVNGGSLMQIFRSPRQFVCAVKWHLLQVDSPDAYSVIFGPLNIRLTRCTLFSTFVHPVSFQQSSDGAAANCSYLVSHVQIMILRFSQRALPSAIYFLLAVLLLVHAKKDGPTISSNKFENALENLFYFDDSNVILGHDRESNTVWRSANAGESWNKIDGQGQAGEIFDLWPHPFDNKRAYMLGFKTTHWVTVNQGETWRKFDSEVQPALFRTSPLAFHGRDPKKVIWNGEYCIGGIACEETAYYTDDDFETVKLLYDGSRGCVWAVGTPDYALELGASIKDRVFCIARGLYSPWARGQPITRLRRLFCQIRNRAGNG